MFEKEAEDWVIDRVCKDCSRYKKCKSKECCTCKECSKEKWQYGAEFGYEEGIGRLRYCCTCKHWTRCGDGNMYGICADWEIREEG